MLPRTTDDIADIPEQAREFYTQADGGGYRLQAEDDDGAELKQSLKAERERGKKARETVTELKAKLEGIDLEAYQSFQADAEKRAENEAAAAGEWDKLKAQYTAKHTAEIEKRDLRITDLSDAISRTLVDAEATRAIIEAKGSPALLLPLVLNSARAVEDDGQFVVRVLDKQTGATRVSLDPSSDAYMSVAELVDELRSDERFARAFDASGSSGGGASTQSHAGTGKVRAPKTRADLVGTLEKSAFIHKHGNQAYMDLPRQ